MWIRYSASELGSGVCGGLVPQGGIAKPETSHTAICSGVLTLASLRGLAAVPVLFWKARARRPGIPTK